MRNRLLVLSQIGLLALAASPAVADDAAIQSAMSAAPKAVAEHARIVTIDAAGKIVELRPGSNGFTCIPDNPDSPGKDPMCVDANGWAWATAWMAHKAPEPGKIGFGYMLMGGSDASNTDPFSTKPVGPQWVDTGPHIMIFNPGDAMEGYPRPGEHPDTSQPYVMWAGTPYEHLMIPVK